MTGRNVAKLVGTIFLCELVGAVGALFTASAIPTWYAALVKPRFSPPNWVFGPVWTTLYLLMGVAFFLVWTSSRDTRAKRLAMAIFGIQLLLNAIWSPLFFGLRNIGAGLFDITLLWGAIAYTIFLFFKVSRPAAYLLFLYIVWVSFALCLNYALWILN